MGITIFDFSRETLCKVETLFFMNEDCSPNLSFIIALKLNFQNGEGITVAAADDDSVSYESIDWFDPETIAVDVSESHLWRDMIGEKLMWCWRFKNQCFTEDGVQFQFGTDSSNMCPIIQVIVEGTGLSIYRMESVVTNGEK